MRPFAGSTAGQAPCVASLLFALLLLLGFADASAQIAGRTVPLTGPVVVAIEVHDTLQPARAHAFASAVAQANEQHARAILVNLSTPGGMKQSADEMVAAMRQSDVPVLVWAGAANTRVSGEGLRLLAEAGVALIAPHVFLTPLWTDVPRRLGPEERAEESQSLMTELATAVNRHGRGPQALEELTSGVHWFSAEEAVDASFVDAIAVTEADVLRIAQGRLVHRGGRATVLDLTGVAMQNTGNTAQQMLLSALMNPDLAVLLLTLGLLLIYLEVNTPGAIVPGAAGVGLVLLAGYALRMLPLSTLGLLACAAAILLLALEARFPTHGILASFGVASLVGGPLTLVDGPMPQLEVGWGTALGAGLGFGGVTACLVVLGIEARRAKVKTGSEAMLGWLAVAQTALAPEGQVLVRGELWRARLTTSDSSVAAGERVKVLRADGLALEVTAVPIAQTA